ncbi:uncharacterized protein MONBRDRAFT_11201 [Monosiga brevicollis MX1]|uniref:non-specific serine/threonine protein kinase n=1 Tax=Monosiga brevicollis TaxID=81824 RepID=A9V8I0_MONBE|nr:uncharacterized protein MONBRDRAFT_11201 [Monosiga brevicollis MX1]EDQ86148.1 predicted protein [Monosiga brevicollis MX1]|eukprot:XP_001749073.1 hypothetical protein [Monosiga brevicollis MX1]
MPNGREKAGGREAVKVKEQPYEEEEESTDGVLGFGINVVLQQHLHHLCMTVKAGAMQRCSAIILFVNSDQVQQHEPSKVVTCGEKKGGLSKRSSPYAHRHQNKRQRTEASSKRVDTALLVAQYLRLAYACVYGENLVPPAALSVAFVTVRTVGSRQSPRHAAVGEGALNWIDGYFKHTSPPILVSRADQMAAAPGPLAMPRIAIVGAGLSGVAAGAIIIRRLPAAQLTIFERAEANRDEGYGLDLNAEGQATLRAAGMFHRYGEVSRPNSNVTKVFSASADAPMSVRWKPALLKWLFPRSMPDEPESSRAGLRELFLDAMRECPERVDIRYSQDVQDLRPVEGGQASELLDGQGQPLGVFDLVIDASGVHSKLRRHRVVDEEGLRWGGQMLIHGLLKDPESSLPPQFVSRLGEGSFFVMAHGFFMAFQRFKAELQDHSTALIYMFHRTPKEDDPWGASVFEEVGIKQARTRSAGTHHKGSAEHDSLRKFLHQDMNREILPRLILPTPEGLYEALVQNQPQKSDFVVQKVLGTGQFGKVDLVKDTKNNQLFAMKTLLKSASANDQAQVFEERDVMVAANGMGKSQWITHLHYTFHDNAALYLVLDFHPGGDLFALMDRVKALFGTDPDTSGWPCFPEEVARFYVAELLLALEELHGLGFLHRDIKAENLMVGADGHLRLVDFGSAIRTDSNGMAYSRPVGTPAYLPPELVGAFNGQQDIAYTPQSAAVDVWACGITVFELVNGDVPFGVDAFEVYPVLEELSKDPDGVHSRLDFPEPTSQSFKDFVFALVAAKDQRPSVRAAMNHPFLCDLQLTEPSVLQRLKPPFVPQLKTADDTSHFDEVEPASLRQFAAQNQPFVQVNSDFDPSALSFVGFTYSHEPDLVNNSTNKTREPRTALKSQTAVREGSEAPERSREVAELRERLASARAELQQHQGALVDRDHKVKTLQEELERFKDQVANLESDRAQQQSQLDKLQAATSDQHRDKLRRNSSMTTNINALQDQLASLNEENCELRARLESAEALADERQRLVREAQRSRQDETAKREGLGLELDKCQNQLTRAERRIESLEQQALDAAEKKIQRLQEELQAKSSAPGSGPASTRTRQGLRRSRSIFAEGTEEGPQAQREIRLLQSKLERAEHDLQTMREQYDRVIDGGENSVMASRAATRRPSAMSTAGLDPVPEHAPRTQQSAASPYHNQEAFWETDAIMTPSPRRMRNTRFSSDGSPMRLLPEAPAHQPHGKRAPPPLPTRKPNLPVQAVVDGCEHAPHGRFEAAVLMREPHVVLQERGAEPHTPPVVTINLSDISHVVQLWEQLPKPLVQLANLTPSEQDRALALTVQVAGHMELRVVLVASSLGIKASITKQIRAIHRNFPSPSGWQVRPRFQLPDVQITGLAQLPWTDSEWLVGTSDGLLFADIVQQDDSQSGTAGSTQAVAFTTFTHAVHSLQVFQHRRQRYAVLCYGESRALAFVNMSQLERSKRTGPVPFQPRRHVSTRRRSEPIIEAGFDMSKLAEVEPADVTGFAVGSVEGAVYMVVATTEAHHFYSSSSVDSLDLQLRRQANGRIFAHTGPSLRWMPRVQRFAWMAHDVWYCLDPVKLQVMSVLDEENGALAEHVARQTTGDVRAVDIVDLAPTRTLLVYEDYGLLVTENGRPVAGDTLKLDWTAAGVQQVIWAGHTFVLVTATKELAVLTPDSYRLSMLPVRRVERVFRYDQDVIMLHRDDQGHMQLSLMTRPLLSMVTRARRSARSLRSALAHHESELDTVNELSHQLRNLEDTLKEMS